MEQSWRKKFSTWPGPPRRNSKLSPRLNTPFAKLAASPSSATVITGIFRRVQPARHARHQGLRNSPAREDRGRIVGRLCQLAKAFGVHRNALQILIYVEIR